MRLVELEVPYNVLEVLNTELHNEDQYDLNAYTEFVLSVSRARESRTST